MAIKKTEVDDDPLAALAAADVPLLSTEEIEAAKAEARERVRAKKVKEAKAAIVAAEMKRIEREDGMKAGDADMDELVPILIDLPEFAPCLSLNIDDKFYHGHTYTLPRHVCNSLREGVAQLREVLCLLLDLVARHLPVDHPHGAVDVGVDGRHVLVAGDKILRRDLALAVEVGDDRIAEGGSRGRHAATR